jgi:hypothetical protein
MVGGACYLIPEFPRPALEALRQPMETGRTTISRANAHVSYPARFQCIAAMNPCRCGYLGDPARECARAPGCGQNYQLRLSGPLLDRMDIVIEVQPIVRIDQADGSRYLRCYLEAARTTPGIPSTGSRKRPIHQDRRRYRERWRIEAAFCRLKDFRHGATR